MADSDPPDDIKVQIGEGVAHLPADEWDACAGTANPFVSHAFLSAMEDSGSVGEGTGWQSLPVTITGPDGRIAACAPLYAKSHSQGEYVFDQQWAQAYERAGGRYYPKLQLAAPFSPVPGPRLLLRDETLATPLLRAIETLCRQNGLSSAHASFVEPEQVALFEAAGWLIRQDSQFHWRNQGYADFEEFLGALSSRKRKALRKERAKAQSGVDEIVHLQGDDIRAHHWDAFWTFYQDTGMRKWGTPYLTRNAFDLLSERMGDRLLLVFAYSDGVPVAGALNVIGDERLFGRYWGCTRDIDCLHFELCYYQAIDAAIARGLNWVEAGAQGGHKLARGYGPVTTYSAHFIADQGFQDAVAEFLDRERRAIDQEINYLAELTPFKKG